MNDPWAIFNDPFFIGFNRNLTQLNNVYKANNQSYPPYDLLKLDEDTYRLSLAVAGFTKDDVNVSPFGRYNIIISELCSPTEN